jgi:hypothetical protein
MFLYGSVLDAIQRERPQKYVDVSVHLEESVLQLPRKSMKKQSAEFQIPRTSM